MRFPAHRCLAVLVSAIASFGAAQGMIMEVDGLNVINQAGNPSDGLRYFDLSLSVGDDMATALVDAQAVEANARFATPSEWDDLFAASTLTLDDVLSPSDGFDTGATAAISTGANYNTSLRDILGITDGIDTAFIWTLPDGSTIASTTRDFARLNPGAYVIEQRPETSPIVGVSWLLVSDGAPVITPVPEPASTMVLALGTLGLCAYRIRRRRRQSAV